MNDVRNRLGQVEEELRKHLDRPETAPGSIQPVPEKRKEGRLLKTSRPEAEKYEEEGRAG